MGIERQERLALLSGRAAPREARPSILPRKGIVQGKARPLGVLQQQQWSQQTVRRDALIRGLESIRCPPQQR